MEMGTNVIQNRDKTIWYARKLRKVNNAFNKNNYLNNSIYMRSIVCVCIYNYVLFYHIYRVIT